MRIEFTLPIKAYSINSYMYATRKVITKEARVWSDNVKKLLKEQKCLEEFKDKFNYEPISIYISIHYPKHVFYNKEGTISSKTIDVSNTEKILIDLIFKDTMELNDKYIVYMESSKHAGEDYKIDFRIETL